MTTPAQKFDARHPGSRKPANMSVENPGDCVKPANLLPLHNTEAMPSIQICNGLLTSDTVYDSVSVDDVEAYLLKHREAYERTQPLNRVYIDIDGCAEQSFTEEEFLVKDSTIEFILLNTNLGTPFSLMKASKYDSTKRGKPQHIFSYRITLLKKYGSKPAIKVYVEETLNPIIKEALKDEITYITNKKEKATTATYVDYDEGVYSVGDPVKNTCGRKMRMWNSTKPDDFRPNTLCGMEKQFSVKDTLITYIPSDCERLPEPVVEEPAPTPKPIYIDETATVSTTTSDPVSVATNSEEKDTLALVVDGLAQSRWENYIDFITIGLACHNEGLPLTVWERNAKKGSKNKPGDCAAHWTRFQRSTTTRPVKQGTLWKMLKEDNPELFKELCPKRLDYERLINSGDGHAEVANFFFSIKYDNYLHSAAMGWFYVLPNNIWANSGIHYPSCMVNDIFRTMKLHQLEFESTLRRREKKLLDVEPRDEVKVKEIDELKKKSLAFGAKFSNKTFCEGVIAFLRGLYEEHTTQLCVEHEKSSIAEIMDEQRHLFAFNDCVYDLNVGGTRPIKQNDYLTITCGYNYPKSDLAVRKEIKDLIFGIFEDKAMVQYMLDVLATSVCGVRNVEEWYIWSGTGGNGKGVLMELVAKAFGGYYYDLPNDILTKRIDKPNTPQPDLANCRGKRFLNSTEPESNDKILEGTTKKLTGGDCITARGLYKDPVTYKPQFMLSLQVNNIPALNSLTGGSVRRIRIIPFPFQFKENPTLENERQGNAEIKNVKCRSNEWRNEFILMLLEQYKRVAGKSSIAQPQKVKEKTDAYIQENNQVGSWFKENYVRCDKVEETDAHGRTYTMPCVLSPRDLLAAYKTDTGNTITDKKFKESMEFNEIYSTKTTLIVRDSAGDAVKTYNGVMLYKGWKKVEA
jgi:P4 family phage/plasmid primase-like protien